MSTGWEASSPAGAAPDGAASASAWAMAVLAVNGGGHHRPHHFHEVAGKGLRHFHEIITGKTDALEALHGEHLQLLHAGLHLVIGQVGLEPLENVLGLSALLGGAGHAPCLLETHDSVLGGGVALLGGLLEGGQAQMEPEARVAGLAGGHCESRQVSECAPSSRGIRDVLIFLTWPLPLKCRAFSGPDRVLLPFYRT